MTNIRTDSHSVHGPRGAQDWETPPALFEQLHAEFQFTIDVAASDGNALLPRYWTEANDALRQDWTGERVFCNPPFKNIAGWAAKAAENKAALSVFVIPANTDTRWWHESVVCCATLIRFVKGRVSFYKDGEQSKQALAAGVAVVGWWGPAPPVVEWGYTWPGRRGWVAHAAGGRAVAVG